VLSKKTIDRQLIRAVFELKIMTLNGETPEVFGCVKCNKKFAAAEGEGETPYTGKYYFSAKSGGILCGSCSGLDRDAVCINTSTLYTMQYIVSKEIEKLYTFKVTDDVLSELKLCISRYLDCYIDHEFKSLEMLKSLSFDK
jgi:DNA repair protein RecO (recombination protein O)